MRYIGGKSRIAKSIAPYLGSGELYIEPFFGGGAVVKEVADNFDNIVVSDIHPDLIKMWYNLAQGWEPKCTVSEDEYNYLKHCSPSAWRGLVGFGASYGGKWFGGYARGNKPDGTPRNYLDESIRNAKKIAPLLGTVVCVDYRSYDPPKGSVVYCDPPYKSTQKYTTGNFDTEEFWDVMRKWRQKTKIIISEYEAPEDFICIASFPIRQQLTLPEQGRLVRTEKLWQ